MGVGGEGLQGRDLTTASVPRGNDDGLLPIRKVSSLPLLSPAFCSSPSLPLFFSVERHSLYGNSGQKYRGQVPGSRNVRVGPTAILSSHVPDCFVPRSAAASSALVRYYGKKWLHDAHRG